MYFFPRVEQSLHVKSSSYLKNIYFKKKIPKPTIEDVNISKELVHFYSKLKNNKNVTSSEWTWINKKKRYHFINFLKKKDYSSISKILVNLFHDQLSYGIISSNANQLLNKKNKIKFASSIIKDYSTWLEFVKEKNNDLKYLHTKGNIGNFYGLNISNSIIMPDTPRHDYFAKKLIDIFQNSIKKKSLLVEIGGGYGGLLLQLLKRNFNQIYLNVDILETLLLNYYLLKKFLKRKIIFCDIHKPKKFSKNNIYICTKNYLKTINTNIGVVFNCNSFSEMSLNDINYYFKIIHKKQTNYILHQNSNVLLYPKSKMHIENLASNFPINKKIYKLIYQCVSPWSSGSGRYREYLYKRIID